MSTQEVLRGVNLGNWLLLEKWMSPRMFDGFDAVDEYALCQELGRGAEKHIRRHRDEYITESDFRWLHNRGINSIRIPFGYWLFENEKPFVSGPEQLDHAITLAEKYHLKVLLDLHSLPGSQGPNDHTGRAGFFRWHTDRTYIDRSLDIIEQIAQRYADQRSVIAFSVANEPEPSIGRKILVPFYEQAYERVRRHMPAGKVAFVFNPFPEAELANYQSSAAGNNIWTDVHLYQCFGQWNQPLLEYLAYPLERQTRLRPHIARGPLIVGEWSLGFAPEQNRLIKEMPLYRQELIRRMHGHLLLSMLEEFTGWYFWSYKVDNRPAWSFRDAVNRGWLPERFDTLDPQALSALAPLQSNKRQIASAM